MAAGDPNLGMKKLAEDRLKRNAPSPSNTGQKLPPKAAPEPPGKALEAQQAPKAKSDSKAPPQGTTSTFDLPKAEAPAGGSDEAFVKSLYNEILGRNPEKSGLEHHLKLLKGGMSREEMRNAILNSQEKKNLDAKRGGGSGKPASGGPGKPGSGGPGRPASGGPGKPAGPGRNPPEGQRGKGPDKIPDVAKALKSRDGGGGFLWKPVSDTRGKLAILLPAGLSGTASVTLFGPDGKKLEDGIYSGNGNGDRDHFRFNKVGGDYPKGTVVVIDSPAGFYKVTIDKPDDRID
jgi:hypothetical protein